MTLLRVPAISSPGPARDVLNGLRRHLGGRRGIMIAAGAALAIGLAANWSWLVAIGLAPLLLGVLPCLAMCALGLCMNKMAGRSCAAGTARPVEPGATATSRVTPAETAVVEWQVANGDGLVGEPVVFAAPGVAIDAQPQETRRNPDA